MDLKSILNVSSDETNLNKQLADNAFDSKAVLFSFSKNYNLTFDIFSLAFSGDSSGNIAVLNDNGDRDDLGNYPEKPINIIGDENALLRYDLNTKLSESASGAFKVINANFTSGQEILMSFYKIHQKSETAQNALDEDITSLKTIFSEEDVLSMGKNEALSIKIKGSLDAGLELAYSDVFSWLLSHLLKFLPSGTKLSGNINIGASLAFSVSIKDDFNLFIYKKLEDNLYQVSIRKAETKTSHIPGKFGISVRFIDTDESFTNFMKGIFTVLLDKEVDTVQKWIDTGLSKIEPTEKKILISILNRLGINVDSMDDNQVKGMYDNFKNIIVGNAKELLENKLEVGIAYEYQKIKSSKTVFDAEMTKDALKANLKEIVLFKIDGLENKAGITIIDYLLSKKETITRKFGISFAFGKFEAYSYNKSEFSFEKIEDKVANSLQNTFCAQRKHAVGGTNKKEWYFTLAGQMNEFVTTPSLNDFEFSAVVHWEDQERKTKAEELADFLEIGRVWNCIDCDSSAIFDKIYKDIYQRIKDKKQVKFMCEIIIPASEMAILIGLLNNLSDYQLINSLCKSMPLYSNQYRKNLKPADMGIYTSIWNYYIKNKGLQNAYAWANLSYNQLMALFPNLAYWEKSFEKGTTTVPDEQSYQSFVGLVEYSNLLKSIKKFRTGMKKLNQAILNKITFSQELVEEVFNDLDNLVTSSGQNKTFNITFLGCLILDNISKGDNDVLPKMIIQYKNGPSEEIEMVYMKKSN